MMRNAELEERLIVEGEKNSKLAEMLKEMGDLIKVIEKQKKSGEINKDNVIRAI